MLAVDSSVFIAFFQGEDHWTVDYLHSQFGLGQVMLPAIVIAEIFSHTELDHLKAGWVSELPVLEILPGYWERAGRLRASLLIKKVKSKLADTLIAQSCIDHDVPLLTRDKDFAAFEQHCGLKLAKAA